MTELDAAQERVAAGAPGALAAMYKVLIKSAKVVCAKKRIPADAVPELAHDVATCLVERYQRKPTYHVSAWQNILRCEILHAINHRGPDRERKRREAREAYALATEHAAPEPQDDCTTAIYEILKAHERGQEIVVQVVRGRSYRAGILAVEQIAGREWIYEHAIRLRYVWELTRRRNGENHNGHESGPRGADGRKGKVQAVRADAERDGGGIVGGFLRAGRDAAD